MNGLDFPDSLDIPDGVYILDSFNTLDDLDMPDSLILSSLDPYCAKGFVTVVVSHQWSSVIIRGHEKLA